MYEYVALCSNSKEILSVLFLCIFFNYRAVSIDCYLYNFGFNSYTTSSHNLSKIHFYQTVYISMHQGSHNNKCVKVMLLFSTGIHIQKRKVDLKIYHRISFNLYTLLEKLTHLRQYRCGWYPNIIFRIIDT